MIKLDISSLIFFHILFTVITVLIIWLLSALGNTKRFTPKDVEFIWKCALCANVYVDSKHEEMSICPLCGSYNKREEKEGMT